MGLVFPRGRGGSFVVTTREAVGRALSDYGEDALAPKAASLTEDEMLKIGALASTLKRAPRREKRVLFAKVVALAAVEVIEGQPRALVRSRRKPGVDRP